MLTLIEASLAKKILVPLDGSKLAEETLDGVRQLAGLHSSKVVLLRVAFALVLPGWTRASRRSRSQRRRKGISPGLPRASGGGYRVYFELKK
jgi:hypothetical protein